MSNSEAERHRLHSALESHLGPQEAAILMSYLPPTGWADVATKHDLAVLRETMVTKADLFEHVQRLDDKIDAVKTELMGHIQRLDEKFDSKLDKIHDDIRIYSLTTIVAVVLAIFGQKLLN